MTPGDAARVLAACATFDNRKVRGPEGEQLAEAWFSVIGDLDFLDAIEAVRRHYRDSAEWMMPVHVRRGVAAIKAERRQKQPAPARAIPSRFEKDPEKAARAKRGAEIPRTALAAVFEKIALESGSPAARSAVEELRASTQGVKWTDRDDSQEGDAQ